MIIGSQEPEVPATSTNTFLHIEVHTIDQTTLPGRYLAGKVE